MILIKRTLLFGSSLIIAGALSGLIASNFRNTPVVLKSNEEFPEAKTHDDNVDKILPMEIF